MGLSGVKLGMTKRCPKVLYRYMRADHALSMIKDPWLKITPPIQLNDVYELTARPSRKQSRLMIYLIMEEKDSRTQLANTYNEYRRLASKRTDFQRIKESDLVGMMRKHPGWWRKFVRIYLEAINTQLALNFVRMVSSCHGLACFTENPWNQLMWAHYADQYKGVVIGFDTKIQFFKENRLKRVIYSTQRAVLPGLRLKLSRSHPPPRPPAPRWARVNFLSGPGMEKVVRTKSVHFAYEKEWRICALLANCRKRIRGMFFRRIPRSCIKEIIIGSRCDSHYRDSILRYARKHLPKVEVKEITRDPASYGLRVKDAGSEP